MKSLHQMIKFNRFRWLNK